MNVPINKLFRADMKIAYTYDFGSSTDLNIRVLTPYAGEIAEPKIRVLARNLAPRIVCEGCGKSATQIASDDWGNHNYYCNDCAEKKKESYEYTSPIVNSPRMGVCGYTGGPYTDMREWVIGQESDYEYDEEEDYEEFEVMDEEEGVSGEGDENKNEETDHQ